jgi:hypothetical protein
MCSTGSAAAGGVGKYLAEWITAGESSVNLWAFDVQRFVNLHNNRKFLRERVAETFGEYLFNFTCATVVIIDFQPCIILLNS